jgi:hypothetical protein
VAIFFADKMEGQVCYQQTGINGDQGRYGLNNLGGDQKPAKNESGIFRERQAYATEEKQEEQT